MHPIPDLNGPNRYNLPALVPKYADIPKAFKPSSTTSSGGGAPRYYCGEGVVPAAKWMSMVSDWFFKGLKGVKWVPKAGVDTKRAVRFLSELLMDCSFSHEHKEAVAAFLLSEWFEESTTYDGGKT